MGLKQLLFCSSLVLLGLLPGVPASDKPLCSEVSKNGAKPVTDKDSCQAACQAAEGMDCPDYKGELGKAKCECMNRKNGKCEDSRRTLCEDKEYEGIADFGRKSAMPLVILSGLPLLRAFHNLLLGL